jgi:hypothetical protein
MMDDMPKQTDGKDCTIAARRLFHEHGCLGSTLWD